MDDQPADHASRAPLRVHLPDGDVLYHERALALPLADRTLATLLKETAWEQHHIMMAGREIPCPRLSRWVGDEEAAYAYSGLALKTAAWTATLLDIKARLEELTAASFNSVLLNLYRDGNDSVSWHADDEPELGPEPIIASLSLGGVRRFVLRHERRREHPPVNLPLAHGSLLLMSGQLQNFWKHCVPKTRKPVAARLNLTFRKVLPESAWPSGD